MCKINATIIKEPNAILHQKCEPVTDFVEARKIADELLVAIKSVAKWWNRWLGFAANQIGYPKRIIALRKGKDEYAILINPVIVESRWPFPYPEGCYSVKGLYFVKRYLWSRVRYQDVNGNQHEMTVHGLSALYQEMDHIDGILISEIGFRIW